MANLMQLIDHDTVGHLDTLLQCAIGTYVFIAAWHNLRRSGR